jgi:hypothetical protein
MNAIVAVNFCPGLRPQILVADSERPHSLLGPRPKFSAFRCSSTLPAPRPLRMLRALAIAAGIAPGREHEGGRGRRLRGRSVS